MERDPKTRIRKVLQAQASTTQEESLVTNRPLTAVLFPDLGEQVLEPVRMPQDLDSTVHSGTRDQRVQDTHSERHKEGVQKAKMCQVRAFIANKKQR